MLTGSADLDRLAARAPTMQRFDAAPVVLHNATVLQAHFEMRYASRLTLLPPALHPTSPPTMVVQVWSCSEGPWGRFAMAQVRVGCRTGVRQRGFVVHAITDSQEAQAHLAADWGFPVQLGHVILKRHYDDITVDVEIGGRVAMAVRAVDPDPLGVGDVQYMVTMTLAHTPRGLRLVQVEPEYTTHRAERLRPELLQFDAAVWQEPQLTPYFPVSASVALSDITIPALRYVARPDVHAFEGTEAAR